MQLVRIYYQHGEKLLYLSDHELVNCSQPPGFLSDDQGTPGQNDGSGGAA